MIAYSKYGSGSDNIFKLRNKKKDSKPRTKFSLVTERNDNESIFHMN